MTDKPQYRLTGYTKDGGWAEETGDETALETVRKGEPFGAVYTWVAAEAWNGTDWIPLD